MIQSLLPVDGIICFSKEISAEEKHEILHDNGLTDEIDFQISTTSFIQNNDKQPLEFDWLNNYINNRNYLDICPNPYSEFSTSCLATLAFPTLFPDGNGDPTNKGLRRAISDKDTESFSMHLKHLNKFGEKINDLWVFRFSSHPRFGYWAYNMLYGKRLLSQGNFYIKQNMDGVPTIEELRPMLHSDSYGNIMNKIQYYAKNVSGTNS